MARESKNMTQEELGKLMGGQKAQNSKIESGKRDLFFQQSSVLLEHWGFPPN